MSGLFGPRDQHRAQGLQAQLGPGAHQVVRPSGLRTRTVSTRPRHSGLFEAVHRLDAQIDEASRRQLAAWISDQYATDYGDIPLGFLATCYLGAPYVDHRLDLIQSIVEHFTPSDAVPAPFAHARSLVRNPAYEFVEVYASGVLVPVRVDGSVDTPTGGTHA